MKEILQKLTQFRRLNKAEARQVLTNLAGGEYNQGQMAAFITSYLMRSVTIEELDGFREAMLDLCVKVDLSAWNPIDLCGTGGDGKNTFNISTLASFVVAGAGYPVAKHGNNGVSSVCGSSNILAHFGYRFTNNSEALKKQLESANICFLHAPLFHPAMKNVAPVRKELGIKTFFNMLGPIVNPASPSSQLIGVFSLKLARLYGYLHQNFDRRYAIVHSLDGYDEISLTSDIKIINNQGERIISPEELGFRKIDPAAISGGDTIEEAADIFETVLNGEGTDAQNNVVIANAGVAIHTYDAQISIEEGISMAGESLASGNARKSFKKLIELSVEEIPV